MQITDLYQTKIECSTYNANIDSTDTVITVSLIDFNGNAVTGKSVTLTCDKGYFNKKGSTAISGTTTKSITLNTDSNGQITGTWTASEWGLCTFSTNTTNTQINVTGWRTNSHQNPGSYTIRYNEELVEVRVHMSSANVTTSWSTWGNILENNSVNLKPSSDVMFFDAFFGVVMKIPSGSNNIIVKAVSSAYSGALNGSVTYARR